MFLEVYASLPDQEWRKVELICWAQAEKENLISDSWNPPFLIG